MTQLDQPGRSGDSDVIADAYQEIYNSPEFAELRRSFRLLVVPLTVAFVSWYAGYVLLATYAPGFMAHAVVGNFNVGLLLGLGQFASTFGIAYVYAIRAEREIDPLSGALLERFNDRVGGA